MLRALAFIYNAQYWKFLSLQRAWSSSRPHHPRAPGAEPQYVGTLTKHKPQGPLREGRGTVEGVAPGSLGFPWARRPPEGIRATRTPGGISAKLLCANGERDPGSYSTFVAEPDLKPSFSVSQLVAFCILIKILGSYNCFTLLIYSLSTIIYLNQEASCFFSKTISQKQSLL